MDMIFSAVADVLQLIVQPCYALTGNWWVSIFSVHAYIEGHPFTHVAMGAEKLPRHGEPYAGAQPHKSGALRRS